MFCWQIPADPSTAALDQWTARKVQLLQELRPGSRCIVLPHPYRATFGPLIGLSYQQLVKLVPKVCSKKGIPDSRHLWEGTDSHPDAGDAWDRDGDRGRGRLRLLQACEAFGWLPDSTPVSLRGAVVEFLISPGMPAEEADRVVRGAYTSCSPNVSPTHRVRYTDTGEVE